MSKKHLNTVTRKSLIQKLDPNPILGDADNLTSPHRLRFRDNLTSHHRLRFRDSGS